jgi:hypothetical protein
MHTSCRARLAGTARNARVGGLLACALALLPLAGRTSEVDALGSTLVFSDLTFVGSRGATSEVLLTARVARLRREANVAYLEDVEAHVSGTGEGRLDMRCDRAEFFVDTNDFVAEGHVRGRTGDGRHFQTTRLRYDHEQALATTEVPVLITDVHGRYRGGGFRYHVGQGRFRLVGGATVVQE